MAKLQARFERQKEEMDEHQAWYNTTRSEAEDEDRPSTPNWQGMLLKMKIDLLPQSGEGMLLRVKINLVPQSVRRLQYTQ